MGMKAMQGYDRISSLVLAGLGVFIIAGSLRSNVGTFGSSGPGLFPLLTGILLCLVSAGLVIRSFFRGFSSDQEAVGGNNRIWHSKAGLTVLILFLYALTLDWLGFLLATLALLFLLFKAVGNLRLSVSLGGATLISAVAYLLFRILLNVQLPPGPFGA